MMVMMPENVHQRTSQKKQIGRSGKRMARMCRQQIDSKCCRHDSHGQAKPRCEKLCECTHGTPTIDRDAGNFVGKHTKSRPGAFATDQSAGNFTSSPRAARREKNGPGSITCSGIQAPGLRLPSISARATPAAPAAAASAWV